MAKKKPVEPEIKPVSPSHLREVLGDAYIANRPSFERAKARAAKAGVEIERADYDACMRDVRSLDELLNDAKVDRKQFKVKTFDVNAWGKDKDHSQIKARLHPVVPDLPISEIEPCKRVRFKVSSRATSEHDDVFAIPDIHFGFRRVDGKLEPLHSEECVSIYLQMAREFQPGTIVIIGDMLDLPSISRFLSTPDLMQLIQPAIDRAGEFLQALRAACPNARIVYIEGNHEKRIAVSLQTAAPELFGLSRAGSKEPVLTIPYLLRCDEYSIEYHGPYGARVYVGDVLFTHGDVVGNASGTTATKALAKYRCKVVMGHAHRLELAYETVHAQSDVVVIYALVIGTGARLDNVLPGSHFSNWQQGCGWIRDGVAHAVLIHGGRAVLHGREFSAR